MDMLWTNTWSFIVAILLLVTLHEWGHYFVARRCGVAIDKFSIGFGPTIIRWHNRLGTEFCLCALPLGGYVKMRGETAVATSEVQSASAGGSFAACNVWQRMAIVLAGPVVNLLFAALVFAALAYGRYEHVAPIVDAPASNTLAAPLGLQKGDVVVTLNGKNVVSWAEIDAGVMDSVFDKAPILLTWRSASGEVRSGMIDTQTLDIEKGQGHAEVGLSYVQAAAPRIADVLAGPARDAGLQKNDVIVAANGQSISSRDALTAILTTHIGQAVALDVMRGGQPLRVMLTPAKFAYTEMANGQSVERVIGRAGVALSMADVVVEERGVFASVGKGFEHMWRLARYNLKGLYKIATGQMSLKNIGGPIKTAKIVGESVQHGFREFMARIAFVSIGLGVLNLLPIPVLDGGHFFTYLIEAVRRKPVSEKVLLVAQKVGLLMLLAFMTLAFYNDALDLFS